MSAWHQDLSSKNKAMRYTAGSRKHHSTSLPISTSEQPSSYWLKSGESIGRPVWRAHSLRAPVSISPMAPFPGDPTPLEADQRTPCRSPQNRKILCEQQKAQGYHPQTQDGQEAE